MTFNLKNTSIIIDNQSNLLRLLNVGNSKPV